GTLLQMRLNFAMGLRERLELPDEREHAALLLVDRALVNIVGGTYASGGFSESGRPARCGSPTLCNSVTSVSWRWIRKPEKQLHLARKPINVAINSEASVIIFHNGWYYRRTRDGRIRTSTNSRNGCGLASQSRSI